MSSPRFGFDPALLQERIDQLGVIGVDETGALFRPVYGEAWLRARELLREWMDAEGLATRVDAAGNLFGRLEGSDPDASVVLSGSHIDTVRNGGRYDGALGVHAALTALAAIRRSGDVPEHPIEVVALCEEEGSRYSSPLWGTQAILGLIGETVPDTLTDIDGITIGDAMRGVGLDPVDLPTARRTDIGAFVELHIEQGGILEADGVALGVVAVITGQRHLVVRVTGTQNHAGTTPMDMRSDALAAAAEMILAVERTARERGRPTVATVGRLEVSPGSRNVIPGGVEFTVDVRNPDSDQLDRVLADIRTGIEEAARAREVSVDIEEVRLSASPPAPMDEGVQRVIAESADALGVSRQAMVSGAGHDSQLFTRHLPTAMIFTPSTGGISHSPDEFTPIEQIVPCVQVLTETLWRLAAPGAR